jgi:nucleotide-binding universal stress UspA family protein
MLRHLLIPLDGSVLAEAVLPVASWLAGRAGARVTLLHVIEHDAPESIHDTRHLTDVGQAEEYLKRIAGESFPPEVQVRWHVHAREVRRVAHSLVDHADELEPDLVLMCAHGEARLRDWFQGNIAQQVVTEGVTPVLVLRPDHAVPGAVPFRSILVPLDGQKEHEHGLSAAAMMAKLCDVPLQLLTVVPTPSSVSGLEAAVGGLLPESARVHLEFAEREAADYLSRHVQGLGAEGILATACVARGDPATRIVEAAEDKAADLVVLGTHGKAGMHAFWEGSMAQRLLRRIPASFLLVPRPESLSGGSS